MITNATLLASGNFEATGPAVECRACAGGGLVADTVALSIGRGIKAVNRRCRPCGGSGEIIPLEPIITPVEVGPIPDWML